MGRVRNRDDMQPAGVVIHDVGVATSHGHAERPPAQVNVPYLYRMERVCYRDNTQPGIVVRDIGVVARHGDAPSLSGREAVSDLNRLRRVSDRDNVQPPHRVRWFNPARDIGVVSIHNHANRVDGERPDDAAANVTNIQ